MASNPEDPNGRPRPVGQENPLQIPEQGADLTTALLHEDSCEQGCRVRQLPERGKCEQGEVQCVRLRGFQAGKARGSSVSGCRNGGTRQESGNEAQDLGESQKHGHPLRVLQWQVQVQRADGRPWQGKGGGPGLSFHRGCL